MRRVDLVTADGVELVGWVPDAVPDGAAVVTAVDPRDQQRDGAAPLHRFYVRDRDTGIYWQQPVYELLGTPEIPT